MIPPFSRRKVGFGLKTLVKDSNVAQIQDPSAIWGAADFLPRRNLLTYSGNPSVSPWSNSGAPTIAAGQNDPWGGATASLVTFGSTAGQGIRIYPTWSAGSYRLSFIVKKSAVCDWYRTIMYSTSGTSLFENWFNLATGTVGSSLILGAGTFLSSSSQYLGSGWYQVTVSGSVPIGDVSSFVGIYPSDADSSNTTVNNAVLLFAGAQLSYQTTLDKSYQRITDWTTEQYTHAAQKNVPWLRRNYCVVTDDLTSATYTKSGATAPSAAVLQCSAGAAVHNVLHATGPVTPVIGQTYYLSCKAKQGTHPYIQLSSWNGMSTTAYANFDLSNGSVGTNTGCTPSITGPDADGFYTLSIAVSSVGTSASGFRASIQQSASDTRLLSWTAAGTETVNLKNIQISAGPCDYQAVGASWAATYTALALAAGYPISMYSDAAGSVATYGPDDPVRVMLDGSDGAAFGETVAGWNFDSGTTGWNGSSATISNDSGRLKILNTSTGFGLALTGAITVVVGKTYTVSAKAVLGDNTQAAINAGTSTGGSQYISKAAVNGLMSGIFTATSNSLYLTLANGNNQNGTYNFYDDVYVKELPGYHATAPSDAARPTLRLDGNGKWYLERDLVSNNLPVTWATNLTSTGVIYTAAGDYTTKDSNLILSGATNYTTPKYDYGRVVLKAPSALDAKIIKYLDGKRGRTYQLGPELVTNGTFPTDTIGWVETTTGVMSWEAGRVKLTAGAAGNGARQQLALTIGKEYLVVGAVDPFSCTNMMVSILRNDLGARLFDSQTVTSGSPTVSFTFVATETNSHIYLRPGAAGIGYGDNISVREILL